MPEWQTPCRFEGRDEPSPVRHALRRHPRPDRKDARSPTRAAAAKVRARESTLTKPPGSLGRLEEIVEWLAAWQGRAPPAVDRPLVAVFAGNHGVVARGVSAYPAAVTRQMVDNFAAGGAAINQICLANDLGLKVFDLALDLPDRRHHRGGGARRGRLRRDHGLRHGGDRRRHRSPLHRRDGDRQHDRRRRDLARAVRRHGEPIGSVRAPASTPQGSRASRQRSPPRIAASRRPPRRPAGGAPPRSAAARSRP